MKRDEVFKSTYLKASDLKGRKIPVVIESVEMETLGQGKDAEDKAVAHFQGKDLGLVLNMTNWDTIQELLGSDDTDYWIGKKILLVPAKTKFGNKMVDCIRIEPYTGRTPPGTAPGPRHRDPEPITVEPEPEEDFTPTEDDVPF
jgi:hypothetical protein